MTVWQHDPALIDEVAFILDGPVFGLRPHRSKPSTTNIKSRQVSARKRAQQVLDMLATKRVLVKHYEETGPYISPIPAKEITDYRVRIAGAAQQRRVHDFDGVLCNPDGCRECWREEHWRLGQTHAEGSPHG